MYITNPLIFKFTEKNYNVSFDSKTRSWPSRGNFYEDAHGRDGHDHDYVSKT